MSTLSSNSPEGFHSADVYSGLCWPPLCTTGTLRRSTHCCSETCRMYATLFLLRRSSTPDSSASSWATPLLLLLTTNNLLLVALAQFERRRLGIQLSPPMLRSASQRVSARLLSKSSRGQLKQVLQAPSRPRGPSHFFEVVGQCRPCTT